jgi:hypothetical protein
MYSYVVKDDGHVIHGLHNEDAVVQSKDVTVHSDSGVAFCNGSVSGLLFTAWWMAPPPLWCSRLAASRPRPSPIPSTSCPSGNRKCDAYVFMFLAEVRIPFF